MTPKENLSLWGDGESVSPETLKILKQQTFDENQPGTILKDFQILLDYIGEKGIEVSGINSFFPIKLLAEINSLLSHPLLIDLKRPSRNLIPTFMDSIYF